MKFFRATLEQVSLDQELSNNDTASASGHFLGANHWLRGGSPSLSVI